MIEQRAIEVKADAAQSCHGDSLRTGALHPGNGPATRSMAWPYDWDTRLARVGNYQGVESRTSSAWAFSA